MQKVKSWSFSRLNLYNQCPFKFKAINIDKIKEPPSPAMDRGTAVHTLAEKYLNGEIKVLPKEFKQHGPLFRALRERIVEDADTCVVETTWAFRKDWSQTVYNDWDGCYLRVKLDLCVIDDDVVHVFDWKTGKYRFEKHVEYMDQLELYALGALLIYGEDLGSSITVRPKLVYIDNGNVFPTQDAPIIYTLDDMPRLKRKWEKEIIPLMNDINFAPRPNKYCSTCFIRKDAGGPCKL